MLYFNTVSKMVSPNHSVSLNKDNSSDFTSIKNFRGRYDIELAKKVFKIINRTIY